MKLFLSTLGADASQLAMTDDTEYGLRTWSVSQARDLFAIMTDDDVRVIAWRSGFQHGGIRRISGLAKEQGADVGPRTILHGYNLAEMIHTSTGRDYSLAELVQANGRMPEPSGDSAVDEIRQLQMVMAVFDEELPLILPARPRLGETTSLRFQQNGTFEPGGLYYG